MSYITLKKTNLEVCRAYKLIHVKGFKESLKAIVFL